MDMVAGGSKNQDLTLSQLNRNPNFTSHNSMKILTSMGNVFFCGANLYKIIELNKNKNK